MSWSSLKHWFATVDISETDWRLRWPLLLLPLITLALLFFLLRANQISGQYAGQAHQLREQLQSSAGSFSAKSDELVTPSWQQPLGAMAATSDRLSTWLEEGRTTAAQAEWSRSVSALISRQVSVTGEVPDDLFWQALSENLAELENAVMNNEIRTPEAKQAIQSLRASYAQTRAGFVNGVWAGDNAQPATTQGNANTTGAPAATNQPGISATAAQLSSLDSLWESLARMHNLALIMAAIGTALVGLLLWGIWRTAALQSTVQRNKVQNEQAAILKLLDEITPLASGDLRVNATVSEASTGAIADAVNYAVAELRRLVRAVTDSADLVKVSVAETRESAQHLAKASSVQAREIHRSSNYLSVMSDTMAQLSAHAVESSRIADVSVQKARSGNDAVQNAVDGLFRIRDHADMTIRLMKRLVDTSASIHERINDIQGVAKRTDLLALNATISSAAQAGTDRQNRVSDLSTDVSYLADTLGQATQDIGHLSDLIEQDAKLTLESMSRTIQELDTSQKTAQHASANLLEIDRVSRELNALISDIASKSLRQAGVVKQLSANMGVINNITQDSATQLQGSAKSLSSLQTMTADLRDSVSDFKLPGGAHRNNSTTTPNRNSRLASKRARATHVE